MTRPRSVSRALRSAVPGALGALVVSVVLVHLNRPGAAGVVMAFGLTSIGLAVAAPVLSTRLSATVAAAGQRVGRGILLTVAAVSGVIVILPIWALNSLARIDPLDDGWRSPASDWRTRSEARHPDGRLVGPARTGAVEHLVGPGKRWGRVRRAAVVAVLLGAVLVQTGHGGSQKEVLQANAADDDLVFVGLPVTSYAHEDEPWIYDHIRDLYRIEHTWDPFIGTRMKDYEGLHVTVSDGRRVSFQPEDPELTVWYFGGSTMFGIGQRDTHTIPSEIARLAERDGTAVRSANYGVPGWVNWQETLLLAELLDSQKPPDLIVFYDGANDWSAGHDRLLHGDDDPDRNWRLTLSPEEVEMRDRSFPGRGRSVAQEDIVPIVAAQYRRGVEQARKLARETGVPVVHFWQPTMETKRYAPSDADVFVRTDVDPPRVGERWSPEHREVVQESGTGVIDISDALDEIDVPVLWDWAHTNELGAQTVAATMYRHLAPTFDEITGRG